MHNPLVHIFLYTTFVFGLSFVFFADPSGASQTILYKYTQFHLGTWAASLWGVCCILVTVLNTIAFMFRQEWLGPKVTYLGMIIWLYSFWAYASAAFWFGALVLSLPNIAFWLWQYIQVKQYHRHFKSGVNPVPK